MIAYDKLTPKKMKNTKRVNIQLILSKNNENFIQKLNNNSSFGDNYYYKWKGTSVSNIDFDKNLLGKIFIFFYRVLNKLSNIFIK